MLAGNHGNNTKSARKVKNVNEAQLVAFIIRQNKQVNGCRVTKFSLCEVSPANGVQDVADSHTHRIAAEALRELQLRCDQ